MSKNSKRKGTHDPSSAQQEVGKKDLQNTDVKVHGAVEVYPSQDSKTLHNAEREEDTRQKGKEYYLSRWTFKVAVAALAISTIYSVFTLLIFFQTKKAANAAKSAAETAAKQLELSERPWVDADIRINGPLRFNANGANLDVLVTSRNSGHSPAFNATITPTLVTGGPGPIDERNETCRTAVRLATTVGSGISLFPNTSFPNLLSVGLSNQEIDTEQKKWGERVGNQLVSLCVYRIPPNFHKYVCLCYGLYS